MPILIIAVLSANVTLLGHGKFSAFAEWLCECHGWLKTTEAEGKAYKTLEGPEPGAGWKVPKCWLERSVDPGFCFWEGSMCGNNDGEPNTVISTWTEENGVLVVDETPEHISRGLGVCSDVLKDSPSEAYSFWQKWPPVEPYWVEFRIPGQSLFCFILNKTHIQVEGNSQASLREKGPPCCSLLWN